MTAGKIIHPGKEWQTALEKLKEKGLYDIYFGEAYVTLNTAENGKAEAYTYTTPENIFFLPYIKRPVPGADEFYDLETAYGYGGALSTTKAPAFLNAAWKDFIEYAQRAGIIAGLLRCHPILQTQDFLIPPYTDVKPVSKTVAVNLDRTLGEVESEFKKDHRRLMRKSLETGQCVVSEEEGLQPWEEFTSLYTRRMETIGASDYYFFNSQYFKSLKNLSRLITVRLDGKMIAGASVLTSPEIWHYHLSASDEEAFARAPNNLMLDHIIRAAHNEKAKWLHLGGGRTPAPDDSLLLFKRSFSQTLLDLYIGSCIINREAYDEICKNWEKENPENAGRYGSYTLKYRYK
ncbi:MAG: GNAT family N-acetyltransferase [Alphaproteobacteria bacterium]|nr:GNAT family N-acetyltransferase [Alphaproteobacteria bacterium]